MGSVDRLDDRTFKVNFSSEGIEKLREIVKDKLKEFMGDYTDDTLVEYVIVLIRNGRRRDEARNELNVFLGDDSESFVAWLWDHLFANLDQYIHPEDSMEATKSRSLNNGQNESSEPLQLDSGPDREKPNKLSESRRNREWRGAASDAAGRPPLVSVVGNITFEEKKDHRTRCERSPSPRHRGHRKRSHSDGQHHEKEDPKLDLPRRLLQSAVRDALAIPKSSSAVKERSNKRLRSVVATTASTVDSSLAEQPRRVQSVARALNPMATVIRAVAEAAEDVKKTKSTVSVFDRLSRSANALELPGDGAELREATSSVDGYDDLRNRHGTILGSEPMYDADGYGGISSTGYGVRGSSQPGISGENDDEYLKIVPHTVAVPTDDANRTTKSNIQGQKATAAPSYKIGSFVANKITRNLSTNKGLARATVMHFQNSDQASGAAAVESAFQLRKENKSTVVIGNGNAKPAVDTHKEAPTMQTVKPGTYAAIRPLEDANSRTIFVNNVHFGATKDSLSRHFNKFGEVLKVSILSDPATGQPIGSAYVEFMRKEAADNALSLDGTSFMSRILKIVKKSSAPQDATPMITWSRGARGSLFAIPRFPRPSFPRGMPGGFRARPPLRPGVRSMQWKRDAQTSAGDAHTSAPGNTLPALPGRGLTYIRPESKVDRNPGAG